MPNIVLFDEIAKKVMDNRNNQFTLFAKREYMCHGDVWHDLVFHAVEDLAPSNLRETKSRAGVPYLVIPVLPYAHPGETTRAELAMAEMFKEKPFLTTFALVTDGVYELGEGNEKKRTAGAFLSFFDLCRVECGIEIDGINSYRVTDEEKLREHLPEWEELRERLEQWRLEIDREYGI